jgi:hypothetical protein
MAKMCYAQLHGPDRETVEGTISSYWEGKELPPGQWSVLRKNAEKRMIMLQSEMPKHWQDEIERWNKWGAKLTD